MQTRTKNRFITILVILFLCSSGVYFILSNLNDNIVFFHPPSEIDKITPNSKVRVGGLVKKGSIVKISDGEIVFTITDHISDLKITYKGLLPALFREKQGIIAEGTLVNPDLFKAERLLAKHDENYTPPELARVKERKNQE